ncbi:MAG TPA: methylmalonyl Co-A mutase-associated GTPase MeaB [Acidimicrobiales bacterium]|nr:methylmalonyl Co-A mutase-associated GTPase MeaB [Acidimicrobiales bacterium]
MADDLDRVRPRDPAVLLGAATGGDRAALARLISLVERGGETARRVGRITHRLGGRAYTVGITGAPGAGKSTLTNRLLDHLRGLGTEVAVLAVDPSSPFSGGAILGDRVRMQDHAGDRGVYIRSMATRGHVGGLALATPEAIRVLDAAGFPFVMVETVGVGQVEVEVAGAADTTVVVVNPGWGDAVQANKAGLLEAADVLVVNKSDRPGAAEARRDLDMMLDMNLAPGPWRPPVLSTVASNGEGVAALWDAVLAHRVHQERSGALRERRTRRMATEVRAIVLHRLMLRADERCSGTRFDSAVADVTARRTDPWSAVDGLLDDAT